MGRAEDIIELQKSLKLKTKIIEDLRKENKRLKNDIEFLKDRLKE